MKKQFIKDMAACKFCRDNKTSFDRYNILGSIRNSQQIKLPKSLIVFLFIIFSRACCEAKGEALRYSMHGNENVRNCILKH